MKTFGPQFGYSSPASHRSRRGITLIEILLSLVLSSLLLASVYSAITTYFHYSRAGQDEIAKNQLARVLLLRIEQDLRSIVYRPDDLSAADSSADTTTTGGQDSSNQGNNSSGTGNSDSTQTQSSTTTVTDPSEAFAGSASGLFGDMQTIVLHVSRPRLESMSAPQLNSPNMMSRASDLKTVSYFVTGKGAGGLQAIAAASFAVQNPNGTGGTQGLARMEGDRLVLQLADKSGNVGSLLAQTQMLAPEVSAIAFRYYDGTIWSNQWDSSSYGGLPRAVEVSLELTYGDTTTGQGRYKKTVKEVPRTYRTVVFLPMSKPMLTTTY